ncbi:MAG: hypothetical protein LBU39_00605 [Desulfobulbaceae bacterium]|jgi:hypothetical protein|nr:hypothetical protein [Desulfobulbaceae bacterium]
MSDSFGTRLLLEFIRVEGKQMKMAAVASGGDCQASVSEGRGRPCPAICSSLVLQTRNDCIPK